MWSKYKEAPNLMAAEMWKNLLEGEGLPTRLTPVGDIRAWSERSKFDIWVPEGRQHVADEIIAKL